RGGSDGRHALDLEAARHNHTYAEQARSLRTEPPAQRANLAGYVLRYVFGIGALQTRRGTRSQPSRKVEQHCHHVIGRDLHPGRQRPVGIDRELDRRLAASVALPPQVDQHALFDKLLDDVSHRLRGKAGKAGDLRPSEMSMHTDHVEHDAPVVRTVALGIAAYGNRTLPDRPVLLLHGHALGALCDCQGGYFHAKNNSSRLFYWLATNGWMALRDGAAGWAAPRGPRPRPVRSGGN